MIQFNVLGEITLRGSDGVEIDQLLRQPKRLALLAYLAAPVPGTWHRRDTLLALFWPDLDTTRARTSLRNAIYVLRQHLGDRAVRGRGDEEVCVDAGAVATDLGALWQALGDGRVAEGIAYYHGELLPGLYAPDSDGFQRWLEAERDRVRLAVAKAGVEWAAILEREGHLDGALGAVRRALELHPDDETTVRRLMGLHRAMGDRAGALAAFEDYRSRLAREFEAEPAPETIALANQMRGPGEAAATGSPVQEVPPTRDVPAGAGRALPAGDGQVVQSDRHATGARGRLARRAAAVILGAIVIAAVGWRATRTPAPPRIGAAIPVTSDDGLQIEPAISPNGRLVAYAQGNARRMRIFVHRIEGGAPWALTGDSSAVEILPRWSPDNDALAFLSRNGAYVTAAVGGEPRLIAAGSAGDGTVRSASWSPNGDSLAIVRNDSLMVVPLEGVGSRFVGSGTELHSCVWSPGDRWIACVSGNWIAFVPGTLFGNQAPSAIVLFPAGGGTPIALTDREKAYQSPTWSADGRFLWMLSNREGTSGEVYAIPIGRDGQASGPLRRVGLRAESISLSQHRIAYSVYARRANVWSVPIRPTVVTTLDEAVPVTSGNQIVEVLHVSRNREWLVYDSDARGNADIYRQPIAGGRPERLTDDVRPEYGGDLSPDGRTVAYHMWVGGQRRLHVRHLETGVVEVPVSVPGDQGVPRWSPTGAAMAVWEHGSEPGSIFVVRRDSIGGWGAPAWSLPGAQLPVWAPDGRAIAFLTSEGNVEVIPADSGARRVLHAPRPGTDDPVATFLAWDEGRDAIWFLGHDPTGRGGIWAVSTGGGKPRLLVDLRDQFGRVNGPTLTSDGDRFYFTLDERLSNVWWAELVER